MRDEQNQPLPEHVEDAIEKKSAAIDDIAAGKLPALSARQECYKRIIGSAKQHMEAYYRRYPERALDVRSKDAEEWTLEALRDSFDIMDEYDIDFRESKPKG